MSWRTLAAVITGTIAWVATESVEAGLAMAAADTIVKLFVYYAHERAWAKVTVGYRSIRTGDPAR